MTLRHALFVILACGTSLHADLRLPAIFSDHMVLQRDRPIPIWGWSDPGRRVEVTLGGVRTETNATHEGRWQAVLPAQAAGGPHTVTITSDITITLRDVMIGEVWVASGQSNMERGVRTTDTPNTVIPAARHPNLRLFMIPRRAATMPQTDVEAHWVQCTPETIVQGSEQGFSSVAYHFACELQSRLAVPIGMIESTWGGTRIEPWISPEGLSAVPALAPLLTQVHLAMPTSSLHRQTLTEAITAYDRWIQAGRAALESQSSPPPLPTAPTGLWPRAGGATSIFHGMIHPIVPFGIRGVLWYQGESNVNDGVLYADKLKALITGWRKLWNQGDFPFLYVQIAPYGYGTAAPHILPQFWEAQTAALELPHTGMSVINDLGDQRDVHPRNKREVGRRLALLARRDVYGETELVATGPVFRSMKVESARLRVFFDAAGGGLMSRDGQPLSHFEIVDARQGGFVPARAIVDNDSVVLDAPGVMEPVAMRFAWDKAAAPNLVNREGLPAGTFRAGDPPGRLGVNLPEARGYQVVYDLDLSHLGPTLQYDADNRQQIDGTVERIAYFLELGRPGGEVGYVFVAMDPFVTDLGRIGIPTEAPAIRFQQKVRNLIVVSNVPGVTTDNAVDGYIEFWPSNYTPVNSTSIPGASDLLYDFGDQSGSGMGTGSMQVHNLATRKTVLALNNWRRGGTHCDLGIGQAPTGHPDWTGAANGGSYTIKRLRVLVRSQ
jgi:sialate O-acetylesterase